LNLDPCPGSGILELRLERPEVKNAINWDVMRRLRSAIEKIQADAAAKVVLVASSVPGAFCAGADLKVWSCSVSWFIRLDIGTQLNEQEFLLE
jgi:methylglutaconyl-CoA hydratase